MIVEVFIDGKKTHNDVQRTSGLVESVKKSIDGLRMLLEEEPTESKN